MTRIRTIASIVWLEMLRKKDVYVLLILLGILLFSLLSVDIFGLGAVSGHVKDIGLLFTWLFAWILAVLVSAKELPQEEKQGTVYALLAKPVGRFELVVGKWLGAWTIVSLATLCFYAVIVLVVHLRESSFDPATLMQGYVLHIGALAVICAIGIALSTRMNFDAAATFTFAVTAGSFLILPRVPDLIVQEDGLRQTGLLLLYTLMPHFEVFDLRQRMIHGEGPVGAAVMGQVLLYGALMALAILILAWISYRNKRFSRGAAL